MSAIGWATAVDSANTTLTNQHTQRGRNESKEAQESEEVHCGEATTKRASFYGFYGRSITPATCCLCATHGRWSVLALTHGSPKCACLHAQTTPHARTGDPTSPHHDWDTAYWSSACRMHCAQYCGSPAGSSKTNARPGCVSWSTYRIHNKRARRLGFHTQ